MIRMTLAALRERKLRVLTTGFAVLLGVAFMAGSLILTDTIGKTFDELFADVYAGNDVYVRGQDPFDNAAARRGPGRPEAQAALLDDSVLSTVRNVQGVEAAEPAIQAYAQIVGADGKAIGNPNRGAPTFGGNWTIEKLNPFTIVDGRQPRSGNEVAIDKASADAGKLAVGDQTTVLLASGVQPVAVVGIMRFGELDSPGGASYVLFAETAAERLLAEPGKFGGIAVVAAKGVSQTELRDRIAAVTPASTEVVTGAALTAENQSDIKRGLSFFNTFLVTFAAIALFVGSFIIYNTFSILVAQRARETALLRAIGASRRQVLSSLLFEALVVGAVASAVGVGAGIGFAVMLKALLSGFGVDLPAGPLVLAGRTVVVCLVLGTGVSVLSAVLPARRGSRIAPVEAMRAVAIEPSHSSRTRIVAGAVLTALGAGSVAAAVLGRGGAAMVAVGVPLCFIGIAVLGPMLAKPVASLLGMPVASMKGVTGALARNNAVRNPSRTSATASALMIGVGLVAFIVVFAASAKAFLSDTIDQSFGADLVLDSGSFGAGGLPADLGRQIAARPEVDRVAALRFGEITVDGKATPVLAVGDHIDTLLDLGVTAGALGALGTDGIAVRQELAVTRGWRIGDTVEVGFAESAPSPFTIRALYDNGQLGGDFILGQAASEANVRQQLDAQVLIGVAAGTSTAEARAAVEDVVAAYPTAKVQDQSEFKEAQASQINQLLGLIYALLGLAILIAVLGIANTLALSIFERTRELGLLRAVGMTQSQVRSTVRWESVLIALFGTALGIAFGVVFGSAMVLSVGDQGPDGVVIPVAQLLVITVLAALCGVLAAVLPARRAAKLDILAALAV